MAGLGNRVRVVVLGAWKDGRDARYERPFVGMTVARAILALDSDEKKIGLPDGVVAIAPYYLNGVEVNEFSDAVLKAGDVLSADDP